MLGFNYRIGEMNAAVGAVQTRRVPQVLVANRRHKQALTEALSKVDGISFSKLADPNGDSATFLNMFLPDAASAQRVVDEFNQSGVTGFNYWFTNMYHFINQWEHLKSMSTASRLNVQLLGAPQDYANLALPKSQEVIGRLISFGIRCTWTDAEVQVLAGKISASVTKALRPVSA